MEQEIASELARRVGRAHANQRMGIEQDHERHAFRAGFDFVHWDSWHYSPVLITAFLKAIGIYRRGKRNAENVSVRLNTIKSARIPENFDGFVILQISDLHADMSLGAIQTLISILPDLKYDLCVMTGDYRGSTFGRFDQALEVLERLRHCITGPVYGVLGNHDTIRMVPDLERIGIRMLLNETEEINHRGEQLYVSGIDDAHYYRVDNIEKAVTSVPEGAFSILLSHTPEIYRQAAHAHFDVLLCGHTHGGQICLPGSVPIKLNSALPRRMASGAWRYQKMAGYTSTGVGSAVVPIRFNCPPEVTLHRLQR